MVKEDIKRWKKFQNRKVKNQLDGSQIKLVAELHSKYFKHKYEEPCTCNGRIYRRWKEDIDNLIK